MQKLVFLAMLVSLIGIGTMQMSAFAERAFNRKWVPIWGRPALGGLCVGAMAIYTPQVLAAGHGAMMLDIGRQMPATFILIIAMMKLAACTLSLAAGFRGGLFFASLFVGSLLGKLYAMLLLHLPGFNVALDPVLSALTGMATLGVAIVGGPLTMAFLVLEMTRDFQVTANVLAGCIVTSVFVRGLFGHSFSTWRLYLRGETVCSAQDVGWLRNLTVSSMMRTDVATVCIHATVAECRKQFLLGSRQALFVTDEQNAYHGVVLLPDVFSGDLEGAAEQIEIGALVRYRDVVLVGSMNVTFAMRHFEKAGAECSPSSTTKEWLDRRFPQRGLRKAAVH